MSHLKILLKMHISVQRDLGGGLRVCSQVNLMLLLHGPHVKRQEYRRKNTSFHRLTDLLFSQILTLTFATYVVLGELLLLPDPQFATFVRG
jgi:hypothetical protein